LLSALRPAPRPIAGPHRWARELFRPTLAALALRLSLLAAAATEPSWDGAIYARAATQLAAGEGYTLRILAEDNAALPTAFYPVGFPAVLAVVRLLGGGLALDRLLQTLATTLLVPLSYLLARRASGRRAGVAAAWLAALWPGGIFLSATWLAEPLFALGVGASLLPLAYARRRQRRKAVVGSALGLGLMAYLRPSALPIAACVGLALGWVWLRSQPRLSRMLGALALSGLFIALACVPLTPWLVRNYRALGAPVLVSTNGGVNLLIGALGDGSYSTIDPNDACKTAPLREAQRNRCYQRRALGLIARDPVNWLGRSLVKLAHTFGHDSAPAQCFTEGFRGSAAARNSWRLWSLGLCRVGWLVLLSGALAGANALFRRGAGSVQAWLFAPPLAIAALHMVYLGGDRYHAAVAPMMIALAGVAWAKRRDAYGPHASDTLPQARLDPER
jgi:4-amino-4-deoxy-L-arabinose transferase-like glycosyltransferase